MISLVIRTTISVVICMILSGQLPVHAWAASTADLRSRALEYRNDGVELQQQGRSVQAITMFQKAIHLDPGYPAPHNDLGIAYETVGQLDDAEVEYKQALALHPGYARAHTNLALLYQRMRKDDLAGYHWLKRYELGPQDDQWGLYAHEQLVNRGYLPPEQMGSAVSDEIFDEAAMEDSEEAELEASELEMEAWADEAHEEDEFKEAQEAQEVMEAWQPHQHPHVQSPKSPQQRAFEDGFRRIGVVLREYEAITDPHGTNFNNKPYKTASDAYTQ
jgi:hypothetical protein